MAQEFIVKVKLTVNTIETVSPTEVEELVEGILSQFDCGTAEVQEVIEQ